MIVAQTEVAAPTWVATRSASQEYAAGFNAYCERRPLDSLTSDAERKGWHAANRAEAECNTAGYAESQGW